MADLLPVNFPTPSESVFATYNYTDLAEGTGIVELNAFGSCNGTGANSDGVDLKLGDVNFYPGSSPTDTSTGGVQRMPTRTTININANPDQVDFSLSPFNSPRTIEGTAMVALTYIGGRSGVGATYSQFTVSILKNTTVLVSATLPKMPETTETIYTTNISLSVPATNFKIGDVLKLRFSLATDGTSFDCRIMHDPSNSNFTITTPNVTASTNHTNLLFYVPFKINT